MNFNKYFHLEGKHAFLSASKGSWVNYDGDRLDQVFLNYKAAQLGTELHNLAADLIKHKQKLARSRKTMNLYVNDAIGFRMTPEQVLYYSDNCFGTADAISFRDGVLRIHDLKTGVTKVSMRQLKIYAALFCLEYDVKPGEITIELRVYQNDEVWVYEPLVEDIVHIMSRIVTADRRIEELKAEAAA